ncbi:MAG: hypothetical protein AB1Z21_12825, partial [Synechococcaceae cyanobacterium]
MQRLRRGWPALLPAALLLAMPQPLASSTTTPAEEHSCPRAESRRPLATATATGPIATAPAPSTSS